MTVANVTPPVVSGTARQGQKLSSTPGTWTFDLDYLTYAYQWLRCDAAGANCVDISGAIDDEYVLAAADVGSRIRVEVTATEHSVAGSDLLAFEPPGFPTSYAGYTTVTLANNGSNRFQVLNDSVDYILEIDDYVYTEGPTIIGGRNVVCVGGSITINASADPDPFALALWPRNGAKYYFEGLRIKPGAGNQHIHDGIVIRSNATYPSNSSSRIVLQNMRVGPTSIKLGLTDSAHSDIIQFQSTYPGQLWVDKFTGLGDYNGIMYSTQSVGLSDFHRMNLRGVDVHPSYSWHLAFYQGLASQIIQLDDVWMEPGPGKTFQNSVYPGTAGRTVSPTDGVSAATLGTDGISDYLDWPSASGISGILRKGIPPGGDFVPADVPGPSYVTPGYV